MRLAAAGSADEDQIGAFVDPAVTGTDCHHVRLGDHRHRIEVEAVEGLSGQQLGLGKMAGQAAAVAFGALVFGEGCEEASGGPALLVRPLGKVRPILFDGGQAEIVEHQHEPGPVDGIGHAASPQGDVASVPTRTS